MRIAQAQLLLGKSSELHDMSFKLYTVALLTACRARNSKAKYTLSASTPRSAQFRQADSRAPPRAAVNEYDINTHGRSREKVSSESSSK